MSRPFELASILLLSSALVSPAAALAQSSQTGSATPADEQPVSIQDQSTPATPAADPVQEKPEVSVPGGDIIVTGRRAQQNIVKGTPQVVNLLSSADIARTGEGDIAGALSRVTGLSVVGNGFVYVRGLGDRYSLALLNGSPLPSPEPLKRVVPLDIFPTSVIASSLVQKSYSPNFPGEFGGGVINLTTKSVPKEAFLSITGGIGVDSTATGQLGYTYYGSSTDWTGYDGGPRQQPPALRAFLNSGQRISQGTIDSTEIAAQLITGRNAVIQRNKALPPNVQATLTGGKSWDLGGSTLGLIASAGYSNKWKVRDTIQQTANTLDLSSRELDFERVITDNRLVVNGLVGATLEFGRNKLRWTNLYIHDTIKEARLGIGQRATTSTTATLQQQDTAFFERQLINTQLVGEFKLSDALSLDLRGSYANSKRLAPYELSFEYFRSNSASDPFGQYFVNQLNNGQRGNATVSFSRLNENLYSAGADLTYKITPDFSATVGYAWTDTARTTERRDFQFSGNSTIPYGVGLLRPDLLLEPAAVRYFGIQLIDTNEGNPKFLSRLRTNAGYGQIQAQFTDTLSANIGVRYESGRQRVDPVQVFTTPNANPASTRISRDYWLPAATITWQVRPDMQFRASGSKTIARPQFRELVFQIYYDTDSNRQFRGNPNLQDTQLYNAEGRWEWYFARDQRISVAGFYKKIDKPIEAFASFSDNNVITTFANAPSADLYGAEIETQKYFNLDSLGGSFFDTRRLVLIANYTYTSSKIKVGENDTTSVFASSSTRALDYFRNGVPLTGQSDHIANFEIGLEDKDKLSQQTLLLNYASRRASIRGASGQPDVYQYPGLQLDFVARQGVKLFGINTEMKLEGRNLTGTHYREYQQSGSNRIYYNLYRQGTTGTFSITVNF